MTRDTLIEIVATLLLALVALGAVLAIVLGLGCDRLGAMRPPADPVAAINAAAESQRVCTDAARICDECEQSPGPTHAEVLASPCALMCLDAMTACVEASQALAGALEPDAGAGGR
jgi:hypothetical protein